MRFHTASAVCAIPWDFHPPDLAIGDGTKKFSSNHSGWATQDINNSSTQSGIGHTVAIVVYRESVTGHCAA